MEVSICSKNPSKHFQVNVFYAILDTARQQQDVNLRKMMTCWDTLPTLILKISLPVRYSSKTDACGCRPCCSSWHRKSVSKAFSFLLGRWWHCAPRKPDENSNNASEEIGELPCVSGSCNKCLPVYFCFFTGTIFSSAHIFNSLWSVQSNSTLALHQSEIWKGFFQNAAPHGLDCALCLGGNLDSLIIMHIERDASVPVSSIIQRFAVSSKELFNYLF